MEKQIFIYFLFIWDLFEPCKFPIIWDCDIFKSQQAQVLHCCNMWSGLEE